MWETAGLPAVFAQWSSDDPHAPTALVYGHHDVQPVTPLDRWQHPPFEPTVVGERLFARGAADDKGQVWFHLLGLAAHLAATGRRSPAVHLKLIVEGEEESGSPNFAKLLHEHAQRLACDVVVVSDTGMWSREAPTVCTGMRGMTDGQVDFRGPTGDVHSGSFGGAIRNPLTEMCRVFAAMHDDDGHVRIPGFYDGIAEMTEEERAVVARLPFDETAWLANPYFAPGRKMRDALCRAAERGVDVTLLLGVGQFRIQDAVARSFYPKLLKHGVKIFEYQKTQLHGKVAVVDDEWATVGSSNYDGFSLFVNQEANIVVKDSNFAHALRDHIRSGVADAVRIHAEEFSNTPWHKRAWYGAAFLLYRSLLRIITMGKYT